MKKLLALSLAGCMAVSLAACGGGSASSAASSTASSATAESTATTGGTLKVAAIETAYGSAMWEAVCKAFEASHPGVTVELTTDKNLEDVIGANMKAGDYPDVVHLATGRPAALTETMIKDKALEDLTDVLDMTVPGESVKVKDKIAGGFTDSSLTNPYNDGKTYLMPMFYSPCGLFYDANLLKTKGWEVPTTWDEMWALGDKAKAEGIALFAYPTAGYFDAFFYSLLYEVGGPEFFTKCMNYTEGIWDTPEAKQAFDIVTKLASYTESTVPANANNDNYLKNQQLVLDDKAIFMPNGTWVTGEMADAPRADGFTWGFTALPAVTAGGDRYSYTWFEQCWVPSAAKNKDLAKEFVAYLYSDEAAELFANTEITKDDGTKGTSGAIQPIVGFADKLTGDNKLFYSIYDNGAKAALGNFAATEPVEGVSMADAVFGAVDSLVSGAKTEDQWIAGIKEASDSLRPALIS